MVESQNPAVNLLRNPVKQDLSVKEFLLETLAVVGGSFGAHNSGYCGAACKWAEGEACGREIWMALARLFHRGSIIEKKLCNNMVGSKGNFLRSEHLYLLFTFPL